jgi:hypothetical protein
MADSKVQKALKLIEKGENPHAAARLAGLATSSSVYKALKLKRDQEAGLCPHCGQKMPKK